MTARGLQNFIPWDSIWNPIYETVTSTLDLGLRDTYPASSCQFAAEDFDLFNKSGNIDYKSVNMSFQTIKVDRIAPLVVIASVVLGALTTRLSVHSYLALLVNYRWRCVR